MSTTPVRINEEDVAIARLAAEAQGRSTAQQVAHWARIGREFEAAPSSSVREVAEVLAGSRSYDLLDGREQARVRALWAERLGERLAVADLAAEFTAAGHAFATMDEHGEVRVHGQAEYGSDTDRPTDRALEALRGVLQTVADAPAPG